MYNLTQRFILSSVALLFLGLSLYFTMYVYQPTEYPDLAESAIFLPLHDIFILSGTILALLAIVTSTQPWITKGDEFYGMPSPLEHPGLQVNLLVLFLIAPIYYFTSDISPQFWQGERLREGCEHLFMICTLSILNVIAGFYIMKKWSKKRRREKAPD